MTALLKTVFDYGALVFAVGFLAPLLAQIIERTSWTPPFGLSPLLVALAVALMLGAIAQVRGRWI